MITLKKKEKIYYTFNVSQWNQTFFQVMSTFSFGPFIMKFTDNVKSNRHVQVMSKTKKRQKWRYKVLFR